MEGSGYQYAVKLSNGSMTWFSDKVAAKKYIAQYGGELRQWRRGKWSAPE